MVENHCMPSKKKKKKKKSLRPQKPQEIEFNLDFTDITMIEAEGHFDRVKELVEEDIGPHKWTVKTHLMIESPFGLGRLELDFKHDKSIWIIDYACSGNPMTTPDLSALMRWSQTSGWKIPQPAATLVRANVQFWRYMWETLIVDSDYLDERFGTRKSLDMREVPKTPMELAEEEEEIEGLDEVTKAARRAAWKENIGIDTAKPKQDDAQ